MLFRELLNTIDEINARNELWAYDSSVERVNLFRMRLYYSNFMNYANFNAE